MKAMGTVVLGHDTPTCAVMTPAIRGVTELAFKIEHIDEVRPHPAAT